MTVKAGILVLGLLLSASLCKAQDSCQWISAATVTDAPDPTVSDLQSIVANNGNTCTFRYRKADLLYNVQIAIHTSANSKIDTPAKDAQCKTGRVALTGIGNEATLCSSPHAAQAIGRVRDQIFVVDVSVKAGHDSTDMTKPLGDMATMMAEQVAGNLF